MDLYSASVEDFETVCCFLELQETKESPMKMQKPLTDLLLSGQEAQSESTNPLSSTIEDDPNNNPYSLVPCMY